MTIGEIFTFFQISADGLSKEEIHRRVKKAYRKLVLKHHPDRGGDIALFRQAQNAYDAFKDLNEGYKVPGEERATSALFFVFRDYVCSVTEFKMDDLMALACSAEELDWFVYFAEKGVEAKFFMSRHWFSGDERRYNWLVLFLPDNITLPRFYRAYAMRCLSMDSEEFKAIEKMYVKALPWNFDWLKSFYGL